MRTLKTIALKSDYDLTFTSYHANCAAFNRVFRRIEDKLLELHGIVLSYARSKYAMKYYWFSDERGTLVPCSPHESTYIAPICPDLEAVVNPTFTFTDGL